MKLQDLRVGNGFDVHPWGVGKKLVLGGVEIPFDKGLLGHSDGDALLHAVIDALCGATGRGDIGHFFPDTDPKWKDADSRELFRSVMKELRSDGWRVINIDSTVVTELPKMAPLRFEIQKSIAELAEVSPDQVGVKATTCEKLGFLGRGEGLLALATVLVVKENG
ncbi:MAG: 2-C-methyl-D-erythritol 2,4-cyclodiphosphate synthase [Bdellovibrionales bacterium]|nr:2-C-methyl-D-erythritol 2,4-cyclodiphosphate synthase [Bdellovibrionales bacterium]